MRDMGAQGDSMSGLAGFMAALGRNNAARAKLRVDHDSNIGVCMEADYAEDDLVSYASDYVDFGEEHARRWARSAWAQAEVG